MTMLTAHDGELGIALHDAWHVGGIGGCRPKLVYDASGRTILRSWGNGSDEENDANVQLAAQAPKLREQVRILREAAQRVIENWEDGDLADAVRELSLILDATKEGV